jgi:hypothetical protein
VYGAWCILFFNGQINEFMAADSQESTINWQYSKQNVLNYSAKHICYRYYLFLIMTCVIGIVYNFILLHHKSL